MTKASQTIRPNFFAIVLFVIFASFILSACAPDGSPLLGDVTGAGSFPGTAEIAFAGRVTDAKTGKWRNDYLVIVFLNGKEVGRKVSHLGKFKYSGEGVHDGLFDVRLANTYELTVADDFTYKSGQPLIMNTPDEQTPESRNIYKWFGDLAPGTIVRLEVPAKQIEYAIAIMPVPNSELSEAILNGPVTIDENGNVTALLDAVGQATVNVNSAKGTGSQKPAAQATDVNWGRPLTHFSGNRWQAWQLYVEGQVPGMTWEQFKDGVVQHNQHLMQTGYVFQYNQVYTLPIVSSN
ncbi:MAG: hypothetical protein HF973_02715 [Chloroflexi bacterium]|nr:hypothetical protein [Chloroflexota bacterium]